MAISFSGCQWVGVTNHVSPQVCGHVLDADTRQPLAGVRVMSVLPGQSVGAMTAETGAQRLRQGRPVITDTNGYFVFPRHDYLTFLRRTDGWSLRLAFQKFRYLTLQTNFTKAEVPGQTAAHDPEVDAGTILLQPVSP